MPRKLFDKLIKRIYNMAIPSLVAFQRKYCKDRPVWDGLDDSNGDIPCYCNRYSVIDSINTKKKIELYLQVAEKEAAEWKVELVMFSVTEKDKHHKLWLEVATEQGLVVVETHSKHEGRYKCWMILKQCAHVEGEYE